MPAGTMSAMIESEAPSAVPAPPGVRAKKTRKIRAIWTSTICRRVPPSTQEAGAEKRHDRPREQEDHAEEASIATAALPIIATLLRLCGATAVPFGKVNVDSGLW